MQYYFSKALTLNFDEAVSKVIDALKEEGFGVLTEIDIKETLKKKLDVDFKKYRILGACNPPLAYQALQAEENIGLMLPCNVIVKEGEDDKVEVVAIDPATSMGAIDNPKLLSLAGEVGAKLKKVIQSV